MNKKELYDYIMKSPHNTNPVILKQAIEGLSNNPDGSAVDDGFYIAWDGNTEERPFIDLSFLTGTGGMTAPPQCTK